MMNGTTQMKCCNGFSGMWDAGYRFGEALHPGPFHNLVIGCTNPSGLRSKEALAVSQGPGIWTYSETQLSAVTQIFCSQSVEISCYCRQQMVADLFWCPGPIAEQIRLGRDLDWGCLHLRFQFSKALH